MKRYHYGHRVKADARIRSIKRRALWCARMVPIQVAVLRGVRWRFWSQILKDGEEMGGLCFYRSGRWVLDILDDEDVAQYALHELAHACLWLVQGETRADGSCGDDHDVLFRSLFTQLVKLWDGPGGPPCESALR